MTICKISYIDKNGNPLHCAEEASFADYDVKIANEEKWAKTLCLIHFIRAKAKSRPPGTWVSCPENMTVTIPKENQVEPAKKTTDKRNFSLDELLSPAALSLLNSQGFVCFKTLDGVLGWFCRKTKNTTTIEEERVTISATYSGD